MQLFLLTIVFLTFTNIIFGQTVKKDEWAMEFPPSYAELTLVNNPKCPIQLAGPTKIVGRASGDHSLHFQIKNVSKANVEYLEIREWDFYRTQGYEVRFDLVEKGFSPLMTISSRSSELADMLDAFDAKKVQKAFPRKVNRSWLAIVVKVKLSDGTTYDANEEYSKLDEFLKQNANPGHTNSIDEEGHRKKVFEFIATLFESDK